MNKSVIKCECGASNIFSINNGENIIVCPRCHSKIFVFFNGNIYHIPFNKYKELMYPEWRSIKRIFYIYSPILNKRDEILEKVTLQSGENDLIIDSTVFNDCSFKNYIAFPEFVYGEFLCTKKSSPIADFIIYQMVKNFWGFNVEVNYAYLPSEICFDGYKINFLFPEEELVKERDNKVLSNFKRIFIGVEDGQ